MIAFVTLFTCNAYASLLISPTKAVFTDRDRVKEITLINTGNRPNTYRLSWEEKRQTAQMQYETLSPEEEALFRKASDLVRFSPKQVRLQPGERQVVKMLLRRKANLDEGDFRSHLLFTVIPPNLEQQSQLNQEGMAMNLNVFVNYSVPVVVRNGQVEQNIEIVSLRDASENRPSKQNENSTVEVSLTKDSPFGAYGRLELLGKDPNTGASVLLGRLNGFNVLHESEQVTQKISIKDRRLFEMQSDITIQYISEIGDRELIASRKLTL